jgi:phosphopantothenoylcysteine decarboxylase
MANLLLGVTGSVAAIKTPALYDRLRTLGHSVKVIATSAALYFFDPAELDPLTQDDRPARNPAVVVLDEDEWPGRTEGRRYQRQDPVLHVELRRWADLLLIAPLDANTLAKLAAGLADNCLTCVWRAWDPARPVLLAPAMNTLMWLHPLTGRHLRELAADAGLPGPPAGLDLDGLVHWVNGAKGRLRVVAPVSKTLACNDVGVGALADLETIATTVQDLLGPGRPDSP